MSTTPVIGIDLGTTNSVVAYTDAAGLTHVIADENGDRIIPSVIHFTGGGEILVGRHAKGNAAVEPDRVASVFKRGMGKASHLESGQPFTVDGKPYSPEVLSSIVLRKLADMAEQHFGAPAKRAVITVPHYFGEVERAATRSAGEIAGLEVLRIVNEPTAAAIAHNIDGDAAQGRLLVFDLGGGTFDVTILDYGPGREMEVVGGDGDHSLGGADFDAAIVAHIGATVLAERGVVLGDDLYLLADAVERAEEMKKELSTGTSTTKRFSAGGAPVLVSLTRDAFIDLIDEQVGYTQDAVQNALDAVDEGSIEHVLMVGGSSRIPRFQEIVRELTGREPTLTKNLDEDVARGASMLGAQLFGKVDPHSELASLPVPVDAASHAIGVTLVEDDGVTPYNLVVIEASTPIPHAGSHMFGAASEGQTEVEIVLNEGSDRDLDFVTQIAKSQGTFSRPVRRGHPLRCEVEYTADQIVVVNIYDGESGDHISELKLDRGGLLSNLEREQARAQLTKATIR